jgi:hypothetical protein
MAGDEYQIAGLADGDDVSQFWQKGNRDLRPGLLGSVRDNAVAHVLAPE